MDRFGASDAWLMFSLWMGANGHMGGAIIALVICVLICVLPDDKPPAASAPVPQAQPE